VQKARDKKRQKTLVLRRWQKPSATRDVKRERRFGNGNGNVDTGHNSRIAANCLRRRARNYGAKHVRLDQQQSKNGRPGGGSGESSQHWSAEFDWARFLRWSRQQRQGVWLLFYF